MFTSSTSVSRRQSQANFEDFMDEVEAIFTRRVGRSLFGLGPDWYLSEMWANGDSPTMAARRCLRLAAEAGAL